MVLVASLALKLAVQDVAVEEDQANAVQALAAGLGDDGYAVSIPRANLPIVEARRGSCHLTARVLDSHGTYRDTELRKLPRGWAVAYLWRGSVSGSLPRFGPLAEYFLARELARLGLPSRRAPVVMTLLAPGCALKAAAGDIRVRLFRAAGSNQGD